MFRCTVHRYQRKRGVHLAIKLLLLSSRVSQPMRMTGGASRLAWAGCLQAMGLLESATTSKER